MKAVLMRLADSPHGVFGHLYLYNDAGGRVEYWCSAEEDWLENQSNISCIPAGTYTCQRSVFHKHNTPTFEVAGVPGRSRILFHTGNTEEDSQGCILLGQDFGALAVRDEDDPLSPTRLKWAVVRSRSAFNEFMVALTGVTTFPLEVVWSKPGAWRAA